MDLKITTDFTHWAVNSYHVFFRKNMLSWLLLFESKLSITNVCIKKNVYDLYNTYNI